MIFNSHKWPGPQFSEMALLRTQWTMLIHGFSVNSKGKYATCQIAYSIASTGLLGDTGQVGASVSLPVKHSEIYL